MCEGEGEIFEYDGLSEDNQIAFLQLEQNFRKTFEEAIDQSDSSYAYHASNYMNHTIAAAKALGIDALSRYETISDTAAGFSYKFDSFKQDVDHVLVQMRIANSRRSRAFSVGLTSAQKTKIHGLAAKIRSEVEQSSASLEKKERLFKILADLSLEVDKPRTKFERLGDLARALSGLSKDVAEDQEGWWKWFKALMGIIDEAKEAEPPLPKPTEVKKIEPPRKNLPKPDQSNLDDEIPF